MSRAVRLSDLPVIDDRGLRALLPITSAVVALEAALRDGTAPGGAPARTSILTEAGELLLMPAATPRYVGVKLVSVAPGNVDLGLPRVQGVYVLFDTLSLTPRALVDGIALTSWRTPAVSAVAVRHLAPRRPVRLVVIGTGPQAHGHVEAVAAIRPVSHVTCVGRDRGRAEQLAVLPDDLELPLRQADVVVCATTARRPVFNSRWLGDEALVIAVGSHEPDAREVDSALVSRATVVVETREAALREAGDLIVPIRNLEVGPDVIAGDLAELVTERVAIQPDRPRLFKSVGEAWEDLVIAAAAYDQLIDTAEGLREPHS
jgi:ornithine cyclodeaminase/alanine dehydrogenase-like protein (mu-crystallin family)